MMIEDVVKLKELKRGEICEDMSLCDTSEFDNTAHGEIQAAGKKGSIGSDFAPNSYEVTLCDLVWPIISIGSLLLDVGFDIYVAVNFYVLSQTQHCMWAVIFIVVPSVVTALVSSRWYVMDCERRHKKKSPWKTWIIPYLSFLLPLAPAIRHAEAMNYGVKAWRHKKKNENKKERRYCNLMLKENEDVGLLRVVESFLESAPQLVLQLSILMYKNPEDYSWFEPVQWASAAFSFVCLAWALASYQRSLRYPQDNKDNISKKGMVFQFLWHLMITVSRVVALSCVASKFPYWLIGGCAIHIIFSFIYLLFKGPEDACEGSIFWEKAYCLIMAAIYIFTGINTRDRDTRPFYSLLYSVYAVENIALVAVWFCFVANQVPVFLHWLIPIASIGSFFLGICFMIVYYICFHPKKSSGDKDIKCFQFTL